MTDIIRQLLLKKASLPVSRVLSFNAAIYLDFTLP